MAPRSSRVDSIVARRNVQRCQVAQGNRLYGGTNPVIADILHRDAATFGDELYGGQPAQAALTRSHAAADERLHLVGAGTVLLRDQTAYLPGTHLLAATHDRVGIGRRDPALVRPVQRIEERPRGPELVECSASIARTFTALVGAD